jgi:hypothetical protein
MARILRLLRRAKHGWPMEALPAVEMGQDSGIAGCAHARPGGTRQVLLVDRETLEALELLPGMIRENITTEGLNVNVGAVGCFAACCNAARFASAT